MVVGGSSSTGGESVPCSVGAEGEILPDSSSVDGVVEVVLTVVVVGSVSIGDVSVFCSSKAV